MFFESDDLRKSTFKHYHILCTACARAAHTPPNWDFVLRALQTYRFAIHFHSNVKVFDWLQFAIELKELGHCDIWLIREILGSKKLQESKFYDPSKIKELREILERENSCTDRASNDGLTSPTISENSGNDLQFYEDLKSMLGASKIWQNVRVGAGLMVPYALKMDLRSGCFLPFSNEPFVQEILDSELL